MLSKLFYTVQKFKTFLFVLRKKYIIQEHRENPGKYVIKFPKKSPFSGIVLKLNDIRYVENELEVDYDFVHFPKRFNQKELLTNKKFNQALENIFKDLIFDAIKNNVNKI